MHDQKNNYQDEHPRVRGKEAIAQVPQPTPSADWLDKLPIEATPLCSMQLLLPNLPLKQQIQNPASSSQNSNESRFLKPHGIPTQCVCMSTFVPGWFCQHPFHQQADIGHLCKEHTELPPTEKAEGFP
jgi:hypothetical protein